MTSQLNVDTIVDKAGSGGSNIKIANNSTYVSDGGTQTQNIVQGLAKNWTQVKGTDTWALNDSFNTSSASDQGTGYYRVNFTSSFNNIYYSAHATQDSGGWGLNGCTDDATTSYYQVYSMQTDTTGAEDATRANSTAHGDLA